MRHTLGIFLMCYFVFVVGWFIFLVITANVAGNATGEQHNHHTHNQIEPEYVQALQQQKKHIADAEGKIGATKNLTAHCVNTIDNVFGEQYNTSEKEHHRENGKQHVCNVLEECLPRCLGAVVKHLGYESS